MFKKVIFFTSFGNKIRIKLFVDVIIFTVTQKKKIFVITHDDNIFSNKKFITPIFFHYSILPIFVIFQ